MRDQIFISYSHADSEYQLRLITHLAFFERKGVIRLWTDHELKTDDEWEKQIENAIEKTAIAILLVSADFLASNFIAEKELPQLLEAWEKEHIPIFPVVVKPCAFRRVKELNRFQCANDPAAPLSSLTDSQQEEIWARLVEQICDEMDALQKRYDAEAPHEEENGEEQEPLAGETQNDVPYLNLEEDFPLQKDDSDLFESMGEDYKKNGTQSNFFIQEDDCVFTFLRRVLDNPKMVREFEVYEYCHIDIVDLMPKAKTLLSGHPNYNALIYELRSLFIRAGWEGDGVIRIMWFPPFLRIGMEDTWGSFAFFVKQFNNGISFIASMLPIPFLGANSRLTLSLPGKIWEENGYCSAYVVEKYCPPNSKHKFYMLNGLLELAVIHAENYEPDESHWIADWNSRFCDVEPGDLIQFKVKKTELHPDGFVHNSRRILNVRNITVYSLKKINDDDR